MTDAVEKLIADGVFTRGSDGKIRLTESAWNNMVTATKHIQETKNAPVLHHRHRRDRS
jgi:hypothetical protein